MFENKIHMKENTILGLFNFAHLTTSVCHNMSIYTQRKIEKHFGGREIIALYKRLNGE